MFLRFLTLFLVITTALWAQRRPEWNFNYTFEEAGVKWIPVMMDAKRKVIKVELVPEGQSAYSWKEKIGQEIYYTNDSLDEHFKDWEKRLKKEYKDVTTTQETLADGSKYVTYFSKQNYDTAQQRWIRQTDGIYIMSFHIRPLVRTSERTERVEKLLKEGGLKPAPAKK